MKIFQIALVVGIASAVSLAIALSIGMLSPKVIGSVSSPDIQSPYFSVGGLQQWKASVSLTTATTTVCAIQSPAATSTLESAGVLFTTGSTTASTITLAKAATAFATTTSLGRHVLAANAAGQLQASTTQTVGLNDTTVFGPNQWFVIGMEGGIGTFSPVGQCHATWEAYNL